MKISIFGLGYVGCVSAGCLTKKGHKVIGVDISETKVDLINNGLPTIIEKDIDELIKTSVENKLLSATTDSNAAVMSSDISIICVGTPNLHTGHLDLSHIFETAENIGKALKQKAGFHVIMIRSTVAPGTNEKVQNLISKISGRKLNESFAVVSNPEFLREGSAVYDYYNPPYTVIGTDSDKAFEEVQTLYKNIKAPFIRTSINTAEMIKYVNNTFHALKIAFANEIGNVCESMGADANELMDLFIKDTKLNISSAYLKPGMAYGGSCLPKDLRGLNRIAHDNYVEVPILASIEKSNELHKQNAFNKVIQCGKQNIGVIGLAFKPGTDDLRFSPAVDLVERLIGKGYKVKILDNNVNLSRLVGKNKSFIEEKLPHLAELLSDNLADVITSSDVIVLNHYAEELNELSKYDNKTIIDLSLRMNK